MTGKKILLCVCGSIAAYKSVLLARLLIKEGADVRVILTPEAKKFITPLTLATVSKNPALSRFSSKEDGQWSNHVEQGLWADALIVAPATANTLAKMAHGICDNLLMATYLSARCRVFFAPAMDVDMHQHPSTVSNIHKLVSYGNLLIPSQEGELASGLFGMGRMAEPEHIVSFVGSYFKNGQRLAGKKVLITAGPTQEAIDPVRFIGNHSTGKMGFALAEEFAGLGADVQIISGPSALKPTNTAIAITRVNTAEEMLKACREPFYHCDVAVFAAAVADYRPENPENEKIKKKSTSITLHLVKNPDIAATLGNLKSRQLTVGFALETTNELEHALEKLHKKNFDLIVLNSLKDDGAGFAHDTNKITILDHNGTKTFDLKSKTEVAHDIAEAVCQKLGL